MALPVLLVAAALLVLPLRSHAGGDKSLHPVVIVPGYGSSRLDAQLTAAYKPSGLNCAAAIAGTQPQGWFQLWPIHAGVQDAAQAPCFADQMDLVYDAGADDYRNAAGVRTRVPFFGSTRGLLGWDKVVLQLEGMGYREGENLFAAPYDFRYAVAPPGHPSTVGDQYFSDLQRLIQNASSLNQGRPAILVAHSFGCALTYQFLLRLPLSWRHRFVKHVVLLAPALGGFAEGMHDVSIGMGYGLASVTRETMVQMARSQQSVLWRLPLPSVFGDRPLAVTKNANFTAQNITGFLEAIGFSEAVRPYTTRVLPLWNSLPPPMVPVTSLIGSRVKTPETFVFGDAGFQSPPEVVYGDGDGAINTVSLTAIDGWSGVAGQFLKVVRLPGCNHNSFLDEDFAVKKVAAEIAEAGGTAGMTSKKFSLLDQQDGNGKSSQLQSNQRGRHNDRLSQKWTVPPVSADQVRSDEEA